jgi:putative flippase GtrA
VRLGLVLASLVVAFVIKRRSVFRNRPEQRERDVLIMGLRTVLIVFGASLLAMVLLQAVVEQPTEDRDPPVVQDHGHGVGPRMSP